MTYAAAGVDDPDGAGQVEYFISHAGNDREWAEWVAFHLESTGSTVELDTRDWANGEDFLQRMQQALDRSGKLVALVSKAYLAGQYSMMELRSWVTQRDADQRLVLLRIEEGVELPRLFRRYICTDLFGRTTDDARNALLRALGPAGRPAAEPRLPGAGPMSPGAVAQVSKVPLQNPDFIGRDNLLATLNMRLKAEKRAVVHALHGWGGVGKTQLVIEYAHRYAADYDVVWWIDAEQGELIAEQMAALAVAAGIATTDQPVPEAIAAIKRHLAARGRWLLIFDNADTPVHILPMLPGGRGHVLITSRWPNWTNIAASVDVDVFDPIESVTLLRRQVPELTVKAAGQLADELGNLPLAVAQAAGVLADSGMPVAEYRTLLATHAERLLAMGEPAAGHLPLAASVNVALDRLRRTAPAAVQLMQISAVLAAEPVPLYMFTEAPKGLLPEPLAGLAEEPALLYQSVMALGRVGLARRTTSGLVMHRLTQRVIASGLNDPWATQARGYAESLVAAANPGDGVEPRHWRRWAELMPHILALKPGDSRVQALRAMANDGIIYLISRGDVRSARPIAETLLRSLRATAGPLDRDTLQAAQNLANCWYELGNFDKARRIDEQTYATRLQLLGPNHEATLDSASDLALDLHALGDYAAARDLNERIFAARQRHLGKNHPHTLTSANNLALDLSALGETEAARALNERTLNSRRRVLGRAHPATLVAASNLAANLFDLRDYEEALKLYERTFDARRQTLGKDHPDTLDSKADLERVYEALRNSGKSPVDGSPAE